MRVGKNQGSNDDDDSFECKQGMEPTTACHIPCPFQPLARKGKERKGRERGKRKNGGDWVEAGPGTKGWRTWDGRGPHSAPNNPTRFVRNVGRNQWWGDEGKFVPEKLHMGTM